ncbi:MBL fold metallo-hydrolase [Mesorhizobium sp. CAU 1741]|uniref:MBL fold metallo-hydrolase n=1 Tax=Mesorhizobium sp. CAU 1741 TaxID=3140366 RepID=UPI00325BD6E4
MKWMGLGGLATIGGASVAAKANASNHYYTGPESDHFDGTLFFNPDGHEPKGFRDLLRWQFGGGKARWPAERESPFAAAKPEPRVDGDRLVVTMVGHATLLVQTAGLNILTDPVWSPRASPVGFAGPKRITPPGVAFDDLPPIDLVLLSHNHYDHLDIATLRRLHQAHDPQIITPLGNDTIVHREIAAMRVAAHDWGETVRFRDVAVDLEPAHHWSARGAGDRRMALWSAFVVSSQGGKIYVVGDTGFHGGRNYRAAAEKHGGFRLAILPIGAYEPRWFMEHQHQNPREAVEGMRLANAAYAAGHHWGVFRLTDEPVDEPRDHLQAALEAQGVGRERFRAMQPGEAWDVPMAP